MKKRSRHAIALLLVLTMMTMMIPVNTYATSQYNDDETTWDLKQSLATINLEAEKFINDVERLIIAYDQTDSFTGVPFETMRLLVVTTDSMDYSDFGAAEVLIGPYNFAVLQFNSIHETEEAYLILEGLDNIDLVLENIGYQASLFSETENIGIMPMSASEYSIDAMVRGAGDFYYLYMASDTLSSLRASTSQLQFINMFLSIGAFIVGIPITPYTLAVTIFAIGLGEIARHDNGVGVVIELIFASGIMLPSGRIYAQPPPTYLQANSWRGVGTVVAGIRQPIYFTAPADGIYTFIADQNISAAYMFYEGSGRHQNTRSAPGYFFTRNMSAGQTFLYWSGISANYGQFLHPNNPSVGYSIIVQGPINLALDVPNNMEIVFGGRRQVRFTASSTGTYRFEIEGNSGLNPVAYPGPTGSRFSSNPTNGANGRYEFITTINENSTFTYFTGVSQELTNNIGFYSIRVTHVPVITLTPDTDTPVEIRSGIRREVQFTAPSDGVYMFSTVGFSQNPAAFGSSGNLFNNNPTRPNNISNFNQNNNSYSFSREMKTGEIFTYWSGATQDDPNTNTIYIINVSRLLADLTAFTTAYNNAEAFLGGNFDVYTIASTTEAKGIINEALEVTDALNLTTESAQVDVDAVVQSLIDALADANSTLILKADLTAFTGAYSNAEAFLKNDYSEFTNASVAIAKDIIFDALAVADALDLTTESAQADVDAAVQPLIDTLAAANSALIGIAIMTAYRLEYSNAVAFLNGDFDAFTNASTNVAKEIINNAITEADALGLSEQSEQTDADTATVALMKALAEASGVLILKADMTAYDAAYDAAVEFLKGDFDAFTNASTNIAKAILADALAAADTLNLSTESAKTDVDVAAIDLQNALGRARAALTIVSSARFFSVNGINGKANDTVRVLTFDVTVSKLEGASTVVRYVINLNGNNNNLDGRFTFGVGHDLQGMTLTYDIKGNGSNIKVFSIR